MSNIRSEKILKGRKEIADAIGVSEPTVAILIKRGLPAFQINNYWYSHIDVLNRYFEHLCIKCRGKTFNLNGDSQLEVDFEEN